jgi:hypothetical protein
VKIVSLNKKVNTMLNLGNIKASAKQFALKQGWIDWYEDMHKKEALQIVNSIQQYNSVKLTPQLKKTADDYAIDVFGDKKYAPWLYVYSLIKGEFLEGWIPDNFYGRYVYPALNKELFVVAEFKSFSDIVFKSEAFPDIAYYIDGFFYNRDLQLISIADLKAIVNETGDKVFLKKDHSKRGNGIAKLGADEINENNIKAFGNCVIQSAIHQHEFFDQFKTGSAATIRIGTVKEPDGKIDMRMSSIRFGPKASEWLQSANTVRVAVINSEGDLDAHGYTGDEWKKSLAHPDTDVAFANKRIPQFKQAMETCIKLHEHVPHYGIIGWDVTVDKDEKIKIMEWNAGHSGITFTEATLGPRFIGLNWEKLRH